MKTLDAGIVMLVEDWETEQGSISSTFLFMWSVICSKCHRETIYIEFDHAGMRAHCNLCGSILPRLEIF